MTKHPEPKSEGIVTRSMSRKQKEKEKAQPQPKKIKPRQPKKESTQPPLRRSPQFNYDRFIPVRIGSDSTPDLRHDPPGSPPLGGRRNASGIEQRAQEDEANRTYDALLRSELLKDRTTAEPDASHPLSSSPNTLPSLVPWTGHSSNPYSSGPTTPPSSPRQRPVFAYRSPRKPAEPASPSHLSRSLFGRASPVHDVYQPNQLAKETRRLLEPARRRRKIPSDPVKVLDAPGIRDDYYLHLMDWSATNRVAVALDSEVYIWDAASSSTSLLCDHESQWVTSLRWSETGRHLAIGLSSGHVHIWDTQEAGRRIRELGGHNRRVGVMDWNGSVISSGSRDKRIHSHDTRLRSPTPVSSYYGHTQEVCGLRWNPEHSQLASGGNDNQVLIWDPRFTPLDARRPSDSATTIQTFRRPLLRLTQHRAAVKALAWSPATRGLLASGGGTDDRSIRLWSSLTGQQLSWHDARSQVCNLAWSLDGSELVSSHGYSENHLVVWSYPSMRPTALLRGHSKRVLYMAQSPDRRTVVTAAADETIRFWDIFTGTSDKMTAAVSAKVGGNNRLAISANLDDFSAAAQIR